MYFFSIYFKVFLFFFFFLIIIILLYQILVLFLFFVFMLLFGCLVDCFLVSIQNHGTTVKKYGENEQKQAA